MKCPSSPWLGSAWAGKFRLGLITSSYLLVPQVYLVRKKMCGPQQLWFLSFCLFFPPKIIQIAKNSYWSFLLILMPFITMFFPNFSCMFLKFFPVWICNILFCYHKLFWLFTIRTNCSSDLKIFANSRPSASNFKKSPEQFFLTVGQNNFDSKYQNLFSNLIWFQPATIKQDFL